MEFIETPFFTNKIVELMDDDDYAEFQDLLIKNPEAGALIPGTGGLRKIRVGLQGRGKRGGARVIYYWITARHLIYLLDIYTKSRQVDLTAGEKKALRAIAEEMK